jgi:enolase-phosphatase E1
VGTFNEEQVRVLLLDIEGTTTPADFVYKTLFPYASEKLERFLREQERNPEVQNAVEELREQQAVDLRNELEPPAWRTDSEDARLRGCVAYGQWLIERDSKCTPLKLLEGKIWQQGYERGDIKGEVYPDVPRAFERWKRQKRIICIYSSGSALAQRLLFRSTPFGDLTDHISLYFDTRVGAKVEAESYCRIAGSFAHRPERFLFISDAMKEIEAARSAGMRALLCERSPQPGAASGSQDTIPNFDEVFPD